jgi:hypothetical protein
MRFFSFIFSIGTLFISVASYAGNVCVKNAADFEERKKDIPRELQTLPLIYTVDSFKVTAGVKISQVGDRFVLDANVNSLVDEYRQHVYIKEVCIIGNSVKVKLDPTPEQAREMGKKPPPTITLTGGSKVIIEDVEFNKSTEAQYRAISRKANGGGSSEPKTATSGAVN